MALKSILFRRKSASFPMRFLHVQYHILCCTSPSVNPAKINSPSVIKTRVRVRPRVRVRVRIRVRVRVRVRVRIRVRVRVRVRIRVRMRLRVKMKVRSRLRLGRSPHRNDATKKFKRVLQKLKVEVKLQAQSLRLLCKKCLIRR